MLPQQNGWFQKLSLPYQGWLFVIPRAESAGGEVELEIRRCGEILRIGIQRHEGLDLEFPQGTDKSVFLENAYFMALISSQIKCKLMAPVGVGTCFVSVG